MAKVRRRDSATVRVEHFAEGSLTYVLIGGVIDESFDPSSLTSAVKTKRVVLSCASVTRISSFGVRQWFRMMDGLQRQADKVYLVECSPKMIDQLNMVAGFAGRAQVLSFYAPYVCESCGTNRTILFRADLDRQMIRESRPPSFTCRICEGREYFDDDPHGYFAWYGQQGELDVDEAVLSLLQGRLDYSPSSQSARPQIEKYVRGNKTFVAIRGTLDSSLPTAKIVSGLEGTVIIDTSGIVFIQSAGLQAWDSMLEQLASVGTIEHVYFSGIPPLAVERGALLGRDQGQHFTVLSVTMPFECKACSATQWHQLQLKARGSGNFTPDNLPKRRCSDCGSRLEALASPSLLNKLNELPSPRVSGAIKRFVHKAPTQLDAQRRRYQGHQPQSQTQSKTVMAAVVGGLFVMGGVGAAAAFYFKTGPAQGVSNQPSPAKATTEEKNTFDLTSQRPDWLSSAQPATAYCFDTPEKSYCVGVSTYRSTKKEALNEAWSASLDELVSLLALRAEAEPVKAQRSIYQATRQKALSATDEMRAAGDSPRLRQAFEKLSQRRSDVAESLRLTGGAAVPAQQSDSYWEEYERMGGKGTEFLGFVRIEISNAALDALVRRYSEPQKVAGAKVAPAFPGLAWSAEEPVGGVFVLKAGNGPLKEAGAQERQIIRAIGDTEVKDPDELESALADQSGGDLKLVKLEL